MHKLLLTAATLLIFSSSAHSIGLGGSKSGKKFNYEACAKIEEGKTNIDQAEKMLKGKPVTTGKSAGRFYRSYQFTKGGGLGIGGFGVRLGKGKAVQYTCTVTHNKAGTVLSVDMQQVDVGSSSAGI
jgi:hypothetical protein